MNDREREIAERERSAEKIRIFERHVDHLMGQLYHQVSVIEQQREHVAHLQKQLTSIEDCPKLLDQALRRIVQIKEEMAGRKEIELDLRTRIADLEREEQVKQAHIERLEIYLNRIWYSPHRRLLRSLKDGAARLIGRPVRRDDEERPS